MKLSDPEIKKLPTPATGNRITYDDEVKGFGVRVTAAGAKSFILNYRTRTGLERRFTIGSCSDWKCSPAREEAKDLKKRIDVGFDPMGELKNARDAKTMADLFDRFEKEHLPKKRDSTARDYKALIDKRLRKPLGHKKVIEVEFTDIDSLHRKISKDAPYLANRTVAVLSKMFGLAIKWKWRTDNPAKGIERNDEQKRHRYLSPAELVKLTEALTTLEDQQAANIFRLLLLTGARRGEVQAAKWEQFDLTAGVWTKPGSTTKQKTLHRVPLSAPARLLLTELREKAKDDAVYVFPGRGSDHRVEIKNEWRDVCIAAGIVTAETVGEKIVVTPSARIHDLRHTYASVLASAGLSLPIIGALLGHSQPATTARYSHLMDDPLRQATERVGAIVTAKPEDKGADVRNLHG
ncbi:MULTISPECIES: site-specific integrase [unclassified Mesorhizobium]|uniref:tyrosine-type recombinase/integrase n=2 Tax=Mesorhizobium TaxID=68287 RepID=UPI000FCB498A|nr:MULTISPECIES: site-specific integrase [unclassified Mesorhizobium]TGU07864.1 site-specific integrase [bacterium M00.F.Ca.ET.163.01.1.1]TGU47070.1 site-specific integrase [bacterium M00.F.Ca.ET.146.01.1.1]TGW12702.1 site-specific integrase [Mesorhizobium sp. M2D.F.Ca.ET.145.01.1.1]TGP33320.1 site-specific integrase [Mesorhizobium sp. M2D.F.Ca.ET.232.01.1.1]TGP59382.1 site-specific integrase [Mesorhizobium sp. M2D.F.Ca.ET.226.01.1.1]